MAGGPTGSDPDDATMPRDRYCPDCGDRYDAGPAEPWRCACGHPLELAGDPGIAADVGATGDDDASAVGDLPADPPAPADLDRDRGLWAFAPLLPVGRRVSLGEGWTPLVDAAGWDAAFKLEYVFPSGSFKDRGATTTLSRAAGLGVGTVLEDSSGNAGAAIAQYAARAGIDARVFVPADAKPAKLAAIERAGAEVVPVAGPRAAVTEACVAAVEAGEGWYASHAWNPAFFAGTATFAMEVAAQRGWRVPDAVVLPVGHGTLLLGACRGFRALAAAGWTDRVPRLLAAQVVGAAPVVAAVDGDAAGPAGEVGGPNSSGGEGGAGAVDRDVDAVGPDDVTDAPPANDLADGIQIAEPARRDGILEAIAATGGDAVAVDADRTRDALRRLRRGGLHVEPTSAVAPAALELFRERGVLAPDDDVVVPLTGSGLKDPG